MASKNQLRQATFEVFAPEFAALGEPAREELADAIGAALSLEAWIVLRRRDGLSFERATAVWRLTLTALLAHALRRRRRPNRFSSRSPIDLAFAISDLRAPKRRLTDQAPSANGDQPASRGLFARRACQSRHRPRLWLGLRRLLRPCQRVVVVARPYRLALDPAAGGRFPGRGLTYPKVLDPLNRLWLKFGLLLYKVMNPLVLGLLFFVTIMPIGLVMRAMGKDFLRLQARSRTPRATGSTARRRGRRRNP